MTSMDGDISKHFLPYPERSTNFIFAYITTL
jgi:hypothetical protein